MAESILLIINFELPPALVGGQMINSDAGFSQIDPD